MPSSPPRGITLAKWYEQNTDNEPSTNMGRPETSTSQKNILIRDIYRADTHPPKSGNTIPQNHDSCTFPRTVEGDARSHVCP
ncbi:hypothetical protein CUMW_186990 [Citrus unshiu]|uniref:Uncharacterized protein n=1 Tax=Citrus unshiu TaxID=55188 RepID=A0A2H5Q1C1_CITUN|nr:hypothetical protein CUMW_186990 [Citrus unshiu]